MCPDPATRPCFVDSLTVFATALVAVLGAAAIVFAAPVSEPASTVVASVVVANPPAAPR